ncbi:hypothetical protein HYALB_00013529 [Hymenoscyphus albidus]|uniref:Uncharacterized protein n=1 Tax=Hymenoscyphus albidus TaxID=595503 RepID=A0A9N9M048_9HELO|nr:hypothetical protein HYALB_00013529 [Hymenoscyphus albidus]
MTIALSQSKYERRKAEVEITNETIDDLSLNLPAVLETVVMLGIETRESVEQELHHRGHYLYLTLTRLRSLQISFYASGGPYGFVNASIALEELGRVQE